MPGNAGKASVHADLRVQKNVSISKNRQATGPHYNSLLIRQPKYIIHPYPTDYSLIKYLPKTKASITLSQLFTL